eukprot:g28128.t1
MVQAQGIQISWGNCSVRNCWWSVCLLVLRAAHDTRVYVWIGHPPFDVGRARLREAKQLISQLKAEDAAAPAKQALELSRDASDQVSTAEALRCSADGFFSSLKWSVETSSQRKR